MSKKEKQRRSLYTESFSSALDCRKDPRVFVQRVAKLLGNHGAQLIQWAKNVDDIELASAIDKILDGGCSDEWIFLFSITGSSPSQEILPPGSSSPGRRGNIGPYHCAAGNDFEEAKEDPEWPIGKEVSALIDRMVKDITSAILSHTGGFYILKGAPSSGKTIIMSEVIRILKTDYAVTPSNWRSVHSPGTTTAMNLQMLYMDDADLESFEKPVENLVVRYYRNSRNVILFTCKDQAKLANLIESCSGKIYNIPELTPGELAQVISKYVVRGMKVSLSTAEKIVSVFSAVGVEDQILRGVETVRDLMYDKMLNDYMVNGDILSPVTKEFSFATDKIRESVSTVTGIKILPAGECDPESIRTKFSRIKGQESTIEKLIPMMSNVVSGMTDPERPAGVIFLYGPPGTGKTAIGKVIASEFMSGKIHVEDMNTFSEKHSVSRLTGAPPGYLGYNDTPAMMEFIDSNRRGVLVLSEIEKAHESVMDHILELLDTGKMRDSRGKVHDARRFIIIMTSNVTYGKKKDTRSIGFGKPGDSKERSEDLKNELKESGNFRNEFISRLQVISRLNDLTSAGIREVAEDMLSELEKRMNSVGIKVKKKFRKELIEDIYSRFSSNHGAREMKVYIETIIKDRIIEKSKE